jgi:selenocysteine lyase/cysteine desulfurase
VRAAAAVMKARDSVRALIGGADFETVFTKNCTEALNLAIFGTVQRGGRVVATSNEHNSTLRPLFELERAGIIRLSLLPPSDSGAVSAEAVERALTRETYLVCVNHVSNVTGAKADIEKIGKVTSKRKILFLVDGAQSLGHAEIDVQKCGVDLLAAAGHKGLHGPQGTGFLAFNPKLAAYENNGFFGGSVAPPLRPSHGGEYLENNGFQGGIEPFFREENKGEFGGIEPFFRGENNEKFDGINSFSEAEKEEFLYPNFSDKIRLRPIIYGGTGTASDSVSQPFSAPEGFESGTVNTPGICGLAEGIKWTMKNQAEIREKIRELSRELLTGLAAIKKVVLYTAQSDLNGVISFNIDGATSSDVGDILNENYGVAVRTGLHCAPLVHRRLGTLKSGAVRAGIGYNNTSADIKTLLSAVREIARRGK